MGNGPSVFLDVVITVFHPPKLNVEENNGTQYHNFRGHQKG